MRRADFARDVLESSTNCSDGGESNCSVSVTRVLLSTALPRASCSIRPVAVPLRGNFGRGILTVSVMRSRQEQGHLHFKGGVLIAT